MWACRARWAVLSALLLVVMVLQLLPLRLLLLLLLLQVLTGDNIQVTRRICAEMGIPTQHCVTGGQLAGCDEACAAELVAVGTLFAKLTPKQKAEVVGRLQTAGHVVGFLGDGTNDALALRTANVGLTVDTGEGVGGCVLGGGGLSCT